MTTLSCSCFSCASPAMQASSQFAIENDRVPTSERTRGPDSLMR